MVSQNLTYSITFTRSARKELQKLEKNTAERIFAKIESLLLEPRPSGCKKLKGQNSLWRIRIGDYRIVYSINDNDRIVDITIIRHRNDVYKDL